MSINNNWLEIQRMRSVDISNKTDTIDSRDIERWLENLEDELEIYRDEEGDIIEPIPVPEDHAATFEEWKIIRSLSNEGAMNADDWENGTTLIRHSYFTEYCKEMLADTGELPRDLPWYIAIDWETTAENIRQDYSEIEYDGVTYYVRS